MAKPRARWRVPSGALVDGRHSGSGKSRPLTRVRMERPSSSRRIRSPKTTGWYKVCQRRNRTTLHAADNATARRHRPVRCSALPRMGSAVLDLAEVGNVPSSTYPPGVLVPQGSRTPCDRSEHVSARPAASSTKVARLGIERSVGARVVDRLQRPVRDIFPAAFECAARHARRSRVVRRGNSHSDEDGFRLGKR